MLGLDGREASTNECDTKTTSTMTGHVVSGTKFPANQFAVPGQGAHAVLFIVRVSRSCYNALTVPNHLPL
jgi:hypothetical protein